MKHFAITIFAIVAAEDEKEAEQKRLSIEQLLKHDMAQMALAAEGVELQSVYTDGKIYQCLPKG